MSFIAVTRFGQGFTFRRWVPLAFCVMLSTLFSACTRSANTQGGPKAKELAGNDVATSSQQVPALVIKNYTDPYVANPGYVGPMACTPCHHDRVTACLPSSHFQTCRPPTVSKLPRGFDPGQGKFQRPGEKTSFETKRDGNRFVQIASETTAGSTRTVESTIDLILGAKAVSDEVYLSWRADNSMWELPIAWVYANDSWGASGFDRTANGDHARPLTVRCLECHNTWFQHLPGTMNVYRREDMILGVTCERCHGPGQEHVTYHQQHPQEATAFKILFPGDLPRERLIEVCTQCHGNAVRHRGPALSFRPGMELERHYRTTSPHFPEDDHVANQISYLRQSKCFQKSDMTCITCHDPHLTNSAAVGTAFRDTCIQCHASTDCGEQTRLPEPVRSKCVECHMRKYVKVNVNFDLADDWYVPPTDRTQHNVAIDAVATQEVLLKFARDFGSPRPADQVNVDAPAIIERRLLDHWSKTSQDCEKQFRFLGAIAAQREALKVASQPQPIQTELKRLTAHQAKIDMLLVHAKQLLQANQDAQAKSEFEQLIQLNPNLAEAHSRLGMLAAKAGDFENAERQLRKSVALDQEDQYGVSMLARLAFVQGRFEESVTYYEQADAIEPYNAKLHMLWANSLLKCGRESEAIDHLRASLEIDPRQQEALQALIPLLAAAGNLTDALPFAVRLNELNGYRNLDDLLLLAQIHNAARDSIQAASVAHHALKVASQVHPDAAPAIKRWLRENNLP